MINGHKRFDNILPRFYLAVGMRLFLSIVMITFFSVGFATQSLADMRSDSCNDRKVSEQSHIQAQHIDDSADHENDHDHCKTHELQCCHQSVFMQTQSGVMIVSHSATIKFFDRINILKAPPFLDGPYQPPRI